MLFTVTQYATAEGRLVFQEWLERLPDKKAAARIGARIARLGGGNFGDCKPLEGGVWELRVDCGPGYRVYYARTGKTLVVLLCGGDKRTQRCDIAQAVEYLRDYQRRLP